MVSALARTFSSALLRNVAFSRSLVANVSRSNLIRKTNVIRSFSVSPISRASVDKEIIENIKAELEFEEKEGETGDVKFFKEFQQTNKWDVKDLDGEKEITLTRNFENEKITVIVSTDSIVEHFASAEDDESPLTIAATILVEKPETSDAGSLEISAAVEEGSFFVEHVSFTSSPKLLHDQTAEGEWQRRGFFGGPSFANLEESVQRDFHDFLADRGINEDFADFLQQYLEFKEQKEYKIWLKNVSKFLKA